MALAEYIKAQRQAQSFPAQYTGAADSTPPAQTLTPLAGYIKSQRKSRQMGGGRQQAKDYGLACNIVKLPSSIENQGLYSLPENKSRWDNMVSSSVKGLAGGILQAGEAVWQGLSGETGKANRAYYDYVMESAYNPQKAGQLNEYLEKKETASRNEKLNTDTWGYKLLESSEADMQKATEGMGQVGQFMAGIGENVLRSAYLMPLYANPVTASIAPFITAASAAGQKVKQQTDKGDTLNEALNRGVVAGGIEYFTGKTGMDSLADLALGKGGVTGNITRSIASQAGEEGLSYLADYAADRITKQPDARFDWKELGLDMLAGGLSGGILAGGGAAIGGINNMVNTALTDTYQNNAIVNTDKIAYNVNKGGDINEKVQNSGRMRSNENNSGRQMEYLARGNGQTDIQSDTGWTESGRSRNIPLEDSRGNRIDRSIAEKITGTAITENSKPVKVFHYTQNMDFDTFGEGDTGFHFGTAEQAKQRKTDLKAEGGRTIEAYLNIKNPVRMGNDIGNTYADGMAIKLYSMDILTYDEYMDIANTARITGERGYNSEASRKLRQILESRGYDGFEYNNLIEGEGKSYTALYPEQVVIVNDGRQTNKNTAGRFIKESDTIPEPPAKANTAPGSYYPQPATPAKTKQDTVYAAYATELDRQIHQEMAKQSANSRNNKISAASPHNIEKTSENNYNVNKEGDINDYDVERLQQAGISSESTGVAKTISDTGRGRNNTDSSNSRTRRDDSRRTAGDGSRKDTARINGTEITYTNVPKSKASENAKTMCSELKKLGLDSIVFSGDAIGNDGKEADTLLDTECASFGGGKILVGNNFNLHPIENACHEAFHEYYRMNNQAAVDFNKTVHNHYIKDSKSAKSLEKTLVKFGYKEENFHNEIPAYVSGWIYSTHYGNEYDTNTIVLERYSKAFENFSEILKRHETFVNSIRKDTKDI